MSTISDASKIKVVFILGATGSGKSKLAISLANHFSGEIINSDKIQVYDAIPVITNRVSESELLAAPHHLLAFLPPDAEFQATDFIRHCVDSISSIASRNRLPIIAGGSNSYIKALVEDPNFCKHHESCFIWLDACPDVLYNFVSARVDSMIQQGLVEEARSLFDPESTEYNNGVKRAIGVSELDEYFRAELVAETNQEVLERMLNAALNNIKVNTCKLIQSQVEKIWRLQRLDGWRIDQVDVSQFLTLKLAGTMNSLEESDLWEAVIGKASRVIVQEFLGAKDDIAFEPKGEVQMKDGFAWATKLSNVFGNGSNAVRG